MSQYAPVILSGYLNKKGDFNRHWKKRWFALRPNCLYYYEDHNSNEVKGKIPLDKGTLQRKSSTKRINAFQIHTSVKVLNKKNKGSLSGGRVFFLEALGKTEKEEWCNALQDQMTVFSMDKLQQDYDSLKETFDKLSAKIQDKENIIRSHESVIKKKDSQIFELQTNLRVRSQSSVELHDEVKAYQNIKVQHEVEIKEKLDQITAVQKENQKIQDEKKKIEMQMQEILAEFEHAKGKFKVEVGEYKRMLSKRSDEMASNRRRMQSVACSDKLKMQKQWEMERQRLESELGRKQVQKSEKVIAQNEKQQQELYDEKEKELEDLFEEIAQEKDAALREVETWQNKFTDLQLKFKKQAVKNKGHVLRLEQSINDAIEQTDIWKTKTEAADREKTELLLIKRSMDSRKESTVEKNYYQMNAQLIMKDTEITRLKEELAQFKKRKKKPTPNRSPGSPRSRGTASSPVSRSPISRSPISRSPRSLRQSMKDKGAVIAQRSLRN